MAHRFIVWGLKVNGTQYNGNAFNKAGYMAKGPITAAKQILGNKGRNFHIATQRDVFGKYWASNNPSRVVAADVQPAIEQTYIQLVDETGKHYFVAFDAI